jgi:engulfment/cell motility protein 1
MDANAAGPSSFSAPRPLKSFQAHIQFGGTAGRFLKASIDENVPVSEVLIQLCNSPQVGASEPPALYCLRDYETDDLVTDDNMISKLEGGAKLKLCSSPVLEAAEMVEKLATRDDKTVKLATFELRRYIQEPVFREEFLSRGGLIELAACIRSAHGNTLSYALASLQKLMELDHGWESLDTDFISKVCIMAFSYECL